MNYIDCIAIAAQHAHDREVPQALLPLTIRSEAALLSGIDSDRLGGAGWD
jgi:hypothetical protein